MTSPLNPNRTTRFEERTEIFQYSKDDDWLLASPAEVSPCNSLKFNQRRPENEAPQIPPPAQIPENVQNNDYAVDPDIERLMKEYENIARRDSQSKIEQERQNEKEKQREAEVQRMKEEQKKAWEEEMRRKEQLKMVAEKERQRQIEEKENQERDERARKKAQEQGLLMQQAASQPPQNQQKERVSLDIKDWLKLNLDQPPVNKVEKNHPKFDIPRNSLGTNRITMDVRAISMLFEENFNKYEALSKSRATSRKTLSYRTTFSQNSAAFDQYFQTLGAEPTEAQITEQNFFNEMEQASQKRLRESEIKLNKMQEQIRLLQAELASIPDEPEEVSFTNTDIQTCKDPFKYFYYNFRIQIIQIEASQLDPFFIYCQFILDDDLFFKLKRENKDKPAQILTIYNSLLDSVPKQTNFIEMSNKMEMVTVFFNTKLIHLPTYRIFEMIGTYYNYLKELQYDLSKVSTLFSIRTMELSRNSDTLSFELEIHPRFTVLVTIHTIQLMKPKFYEFYHIEGRKDIQVSEEKLQGDDLIDILQALAETYWND